MRLMRFSQASARLAHLIRRERREQRHCRLLKALAVRSSQLGESSSQLAAANNGQRENFSLSRARSAIFRTHSAASRRYVRRYVLGARNLSSR